MARVKHGQPCKHNEKYWRLMYYRCRDYTVDNIVYLTPFYKSQMMCIKCRKKWWGVRDVERFKKYNQPYKFHIFGDTLLEIIESYREEVTIERIENTKQSD